MRSVTKLRAALVAGLVAAAVYAGSYRNGWAGDDLPIIAENPASQSLGAAGAHFFKTYWPVEDGESAGQYRPLTVMSYAVDWELSDGHAGWFHLVNASWHGVVTGLLVFVLAAWMSPVAALVAGVVFGVHPVHVEAVANVVGRAELMAGAFLLVAVLCARRYRHARRSRSRATWLGVTLIVVLAGLFSKEHAVIAVALIALDEFLDPDRAFVRSANLYAAIVAVTLAWLHVFQSIAGQWVVNSEAATIRGLSTFERWATMFPAHLTVTRLLWWPFDLAADYNPLVIPRRVEWSLLATAGFLTTAAVLGLAWLGRRRYPAFAFAVGIGVLAYAPTSNLLFGSGIMLAERNLYLAAAIPATALAWLTMSDVLQRYRRPILIGAVALVAAFTARTVTRVPFWMDNRTVVLEDFTAHSENYRARLRLAMVFATGQPSYQAIAEGTAAGSVFPEDPFVVIKTVPIALDLGQHEIAFREAARAHAMEPDHVILAELVVRVRLAQGLLDSGLVVARRTVERRPESITAAETYLGVVDSLGAPDWQRALATARLMWVTGRLGRSTRALADAVPRIPSPATSPGHCWEIRETLPAAARLDPDLAGTLQRVLDRSPVCGPLVTSRPDAGRQRPPGGLSGARNASSGSDG